MIVKINAKHQITLPARMLKKIGLKPGDRLLIEERPDGLILHPLHIRRDRLAPLRGKLPKGRGSFNLETFREAPRDPSLRD